MNPRYETINRLVAEHVFDRRCKEIDFEMKMDDGHNRDRFVALPDYATWMHEAFYVIHEMEVKYAAKFLITKAHQTPFVVSMTIQVPQEDDFTQNRHASYACHNLAEAICIVALMGLKIAIP